MPIRRVTIIAATVVACAAALAGPAVAGSPVLHCGSVRTDRFFHLAAGGLFGATSIRAIGTGCPTARAIASRYVRNPFSVDSPAHRTKRVQGWSCTWRANRHVAQQVSVTCTRSAATIRFNDTLPNG